jgi:MFS family permease
LSFNKTWKSFKSGFPSEVLNKDLKLLFASNLVGSFGDGLYSYLLPYYITETIKASPLEVGILYALVILVAALTLLLAGMLADKYDRKKIMIAGWAAWLPVPIIFSFAENWLQMLPGMILWGVWLGGPTTTAYIVTAANKEKLTLTFTAISSAWSFGYIFSPALGGYLSITVGMRIVFGLALAFYAIACIILAFISSQRATNYKERSSEEKSSFLQLLKIRKLFMFSLYFASIMFVMLLFRPFIPQFLADRYGYGDFEIGVLGSVLFFGSAVLGILLGKLGDKYRKSYALIASLILCSLSLILLLLFGEFHLLLLTSFLAGVSYVEWSLMGAIIGPLAPEHIRARWISIPQTISMLASFIAPYIGGTLYSISPQYPFITAAAAMLFLAPLAATKIFEE